MNIEKIAPQKSQGGRDIVLAKALHQFLEVGTRFNDWFRRRVEEYGFVKDTDYSFLSNDNEEVIITLDMAKELSMVERNAKGQQARRYFIDCEKKLTQIAQAPRPTVPATYKDAVKALLVQLEEKERVEEQLALAQPKIAFYEAVAVSTNAIAMSSAAKVLKIPNVGRNKLFRMLKTDGILRKNNEPLQQYVDAGYFEVQPQPYLAGKDGEKGQRFACTTRVTGKGLEWMAKKYKQA